MIPVFNDLLAFFGLDVAPPQTLGEFLPWFLSVCVALGLVLFVFRLVKAFVVRFGGGRIV